MRNIDSIYAFVVVTERIVPVKVKLDAAGTAIVMIPALGDVERDCPERAIRTLQHRGLHGQLGTESP